MTAQQRLLRRGAAVATTAALAVGAASGLGSSAAAATPTIKATYTARVTTTVAKTNPDTTLRPAAVTMTTFLTNTANGAKLGNGTLPLKPVQTTVPLNLLGVNLVNVTATVSFIQQGKITGTMVVSGKKISLSATARDIVRISNVATLGGVPIDVGKTCQTSTPLVLNLKTGAKGFNLNTGGSLTGTYTIPKFANCSSYGIVPLSGLLSSQLSGPGNKITVTLSNGHLG